MPRSGPFVAFGMCPIRWALTTCPFPAVSNGTCRTAHSSRVRTRNPRRLHLHCRATLVGPAASAYDESVARAIAFRRFAKACIYSNLHRKKYRRMRPWTLPMKVGWTYRLVKSGLSSISCALIAGVAPSASLSFPAQPPMKHSRRIFKIMIAT